MPLESPEAYPQPLGYNPSNEALTRAGYVRYVDANGQAVWRQPRPGVAVDAQGRTYPVPLRAGLKEAVGIGSSGWRAAPRRTRPVVPPGPSLGDIPRGSGAMLPSSTSEAEPTEQVSTRAGACPPGPPGPRGSKGDKGDKGDPGESGPAGEVDYARVESIISTVVTRSITELQPHIEENILEVIVNDDRFRGKDGAEGPAGPAGSVTVENLTDEQLDALAIKITARLLDPKSKAALPGITFKKIVDGKTVDEELIKLGETLTLTPFEKKAGE